MKTWRHYEITPIESLNAKKNLQHFVNAAKIIKNENIDVATAAAISHLDYKRGNKFSAKSPLLIALLASLALNGIVAVSSREGLYGQLFKLIELMTKSSRESLKLTPTILNIFLQQLGWEITAQPYADTEKIITACAKRMRMELNETPLKSRSICDEAVAFWEKAGIVERIRFKISEAFTFVHKTFGEYAAAKHLVSRNLEEQTKLLSIIEHEKEWNEVLIFAASMGLGLELVRCALIGAQENNIENMRLLQWVQYSKYPLTAELADIVLQQAWSIVTAGHSDKALRTGLALASAIEKLPCAIAYSKTYCTHPQWWTALVGWACFVQDDPRSLNFSSLLAFMDSHAEGASTRTLNGNFGFSSPIRDLWEVILLSAAKETVRRGIGAEEQAFIDRLKQSFNSHSMGFIGELTFILEKAGIDANLPEQKNLISKYFNSEFFNQRNEDDLTILNVIADSLPEHIIPVQPPFLHLSAFWYGTGLMNMELSAAAVAAKALGGKEARQVVKWAARVSSYDYDQLIAEVQTKALTINKKDIFSGIFDGLLSVDAPINWGKNHDSSTRPVITKALLNPSKWIVLLAANLAENFLTREDADKMIPEVLEKSDGFGTYAIAYLAVHFFGNDGARELIISRLKKTPNNGTQHLLKCLSDIWNPFLKYEISEILNKTLCFGPRTAKAAITLVRVLDNKHRKSIIPLLKKSYNYWLENEGPYPDKIGTIPESPRGEILSILIEEKSLSSDILFVAAKDRRSEVSKLAIDTLVISASASESERNELVRRVLSEHELNGLLISCLRSHIPFGEEDIYALTELLKSSNHQTRHAATGLLDLCYLSQNEIRKWAAKLSNDPYQPLRDKGIELLTAQKHDQERNV